MTRPFMIDVHTHLGATAGFRAFYSTVDDFVRLMDQIGIELSIFISMPLLDRQMKQGYEEAIEALEKYPHRLRAYTVYDPNWQRLSLQLMEKYQCHPGFAGIKIHPAIHAVAPEDSRYQALWEYANQHRLVVLTHSWSPDPNKPSQNLSTPDHFAAVLEKYSHLQLILGHAGGRTEGRKMAVELIRRYPNCWADLSGDTFQPGQLEWMIEQAGVDRILFGTDSNWIEPRYVTGHILKSTLSPTDRLKILRHNALRLFGDKLATLSESA